MDKLKKLFKQKYGFEADEVVALKGDGSDRTVYRITVNLKDKRIDNNHPIWKDISCQARDGMVSVIGVVGKNCKENEAFVEFTRHFREAGLPVPEILAEDLENGVYLEEDLGDETLFAWMNKIRDQQGFSDKIVKMYKKVIGWLPKFQIQAGRNLDYSLCYQHIEFGRESIMWDLHYFKQNFLNNFYKDKVDNEELEKDFNKLVDFLLGEERKFFLYRDFQSRNVMIKNNEPYFIDYQSGRKGALQYDLASLLYDAKANIPQSVREELVDYYLDQIFNLSFPRRRESRVDTLEQENKHNVYNSATVGANNCKHTAHLWIPAFAGMTKNEYCLKFKKYFYGFALARIMQAFGAYGFLGFVKGKKQFLASIPYAINNLETILSKDTILNKLPTLKEIFVNLIKNEKLKNFKASTTQELTVKIYSFGYHFSGIPQDEDARHNGGFVFDLRCLPNPGREERFRNLTGLDRPVVEFLEGIDVVQKYFEHVTNLIDIVVDNYRKRNFTDLMVSFGCTGGEHRSVYFAEKLEGYLEGRGVNVKVKHLDICDGRVL